MRRVEVLTGPERRRWWSCAEKARIVAESLAPDAVASSIALRYGLHRNQLYAWRKELRVAEEAARAGSAPLDFVPVVVTEEAAVARPSGIEIEVAGALVDLRGDAHVLRVFDGDAGCRTGAAVPGVREPEQSAHPRRQTAPRRKLADLGCAIKIRPDYTQISASFSSR